MLNRLTFTLALIALALTTTDCFAQRSKGKRRKAAESKRSQNDGTAQRTRPSSQVSDIVPEKIAWYGTLESALAEAARTNRPIMLLAARPECRGVPGVW